MLRMKLEILKKLYSLEEIKIIKQDDQTILLRGVFSLNRQPDEVKRFMHLKSHTPALSYSRYKEIAFLKDTTYIDLPVVSFSKEDAEKIKQQLWYKLNLYLSHKLEKLLLPKVLV